jgi:hypothetical protein
LAKNHPEGSEIRLRRTILALRLVVAACPD